MNKYAADVVEILKSEYGIETLAQLERAIKKMDALDISTFCTKPKRRNDYDEDEKD